MHIAEFKNYLIGEHLSPVTIRYTVNWIKLLASTHKVLTLEVVQSYIVEQFKAGKSAALANKVVQSVKRWCAFTGESWAEGLHTYKEEIVPRPTLSNEQIEAFFAVPKQMKEPFADYIRWQAFWSLIIFCGLRLGEARYLKTADVYSGRNILRVKGKMGYRMVAIPSEVLSILEKHLQHVTHEYVFATRQTGRPFSETRYVNNFHYRLSVIGVKTPMVPYDLRHTAITRWLKKLKMNIFDVKRQAGHIRTGTTERYYDYGDFDEITEQLEKDPLLEKKKTAKERFTHLCKVFLEQVQNEKDFVYYVSDKSFQVCLRE